MGQNKELPSAAGGVLRLPNLISGRVLLASFRHRCGYVVSLPELALRKLGMKWFVQTSIANASPSSMPAAVPIYEHHLDEILASARKAGRISYTADAVEASAPAAICLASCRLAERSASARIFRRRAHTNKNGARRRGWPQQHRLYKRSVRPCERTLESRRDDVRRSERRRH